MPGTCAAKMHNADKQGCIHVLKNQFFYLVPGVIHVETLQM